jgi:hypothetical protein
MLILRHELTELFNPGRLVGAQSHNSLGGLLEKCKKKASDSRIRIFSVRKEITNVVVRGGVAFKTGSASPEGNGDGTNLYYQRHAN